MIAGGSGMIGSAVCKRLLSLNYRIIICTRNKEKISSENILYAYWDVEKNEIDEEAIKISDYIIHVAGANIAAKRWTRKRKEELLSSRVDGIKLLCTKLVRLEHHIKAIISTSAIGWYGSDPEIPNRQPFEEGDDYFKDFLGETCYKWEQAWKPIKHTSIRLVILRTGIVLGKKSLFVKQLIKPIKFGLAVIPGNGCQVMSWIYIDDLADIYVKAIKDHRYTGIYNAVSPNPVSVKLLIMQLANEIKGSNYIKFKIPSSILKLLLGEMSVEVLKSTTVSCDKLNKAGFVFSYPLAKDAIRESLI